MAVTKTNISVTEKIIESGVVRNSNHCIIAEGVTEANPHLSHVAVDVQTIRASDVNKRERYIWLTPRSVQTAIIDFDQGKKPKPFKFRLRSCSILPFKERGDRTKEYEKNRRKKAKIVINKSKTANGTIKRIENGNSPPRSIGQRRAFGLRNLLY